MAGLAAGCTFGAYSYHRGLRYPRMGYEPSPIAPLLYTNFAEFRLRNAIPILDNNTNNRPENHSVVAPGREDLPNKVNLRAIAPDASVEVMARRGKFDVQVNNIAPSAKLSVSGKGIRNIDEQQNGITRTVIIEAATEQQLTLDWALDDEDGYHFAVIGDSGGNLELDWCLERAQQLGATFMLHLGDFNYGNGDYERAIKIFQNAPMPCYISIGNHDFNDSGLVYQHFRNNLGEMNNAFVLSGTRFVNIDTAADFFPVDAGMRGKLVTELLKTPYENQLFFTHRPLRDPRPGEDHNVGSLNGVQWLSEAITNAGGGALLTGHVHHSAELDINGIKQYTIGEGLGHDDVLLQRQVAQIMIGSVENSQRPRFHWEPMNMPWSAHKSHTHLKKLRKRGDQRLIDWYQAI